VPSFVESTGMLCSKSARHAPLCLILQHPIPRPRPCPLPASLLCFHSLLLPCICLLGPVTLLDLQDGSGMQ